MISIATMWPLFVRSVTLKFSKPGVLSIHEEWIPNASGEPRLISITKTPKLDEHGAVEYVVCSGTDITECKRLEDALRESEQTLNRILTASPVGIAFVSSDRKLEWANKTYLELLGYDTAEEVKDLPVSLFYASEEEFNRVGSLISSFCPKGEPAVTDTTLNGKTGKPLTLMFESTLLIRRI